MAMAVLLPGGVGATTLMVSNLNDNGVGSLRDAVSSSLAGDIVAFDAGLAGATINLTGQILIDKALTINGLGANALEVTNTSGRIFEVNAAGAAVHISALGLSGSGHPIGANGGAILNVSGALSLNAVSIEGSTVVGDWRGGGIGGAVHSAWSPAGTSLTIRNSTISGNSATKAGAIYAYNQTLIVENSTIVSNIASDSAGAVSLDSSWSGTVFRQSTIAGNTANIGSGVYARGNSVAEFVNTIVAGNNDPSFANDVDRADGVISATGSLFSESNAVPDINGTDVDNLFEADPMLGALANNGGTTSTMLPQLGSPVIDAVTCTGITPDQRLLARPQGSLCDIGAVEVRLVPPAPPAVTAVPTLSHWGLLLLGLLAAGLGVRPTRRD